nr:MAG TPA: hypothetical protein [Caudoviricetes sp.]DAS49153.1 MAG TPA: hypothetical protein [Caudoviricetes sp.]DAZ41515.1 MAG TPA: hypothetical protein [Caudoviricetes sp.]
MGSKTFLSLLCADGGFLFLRIFVGLSRGFFYSYPDPHPRPFSTAESSKPQQPLFIRIGYNFLYLFAK